MRLNQNELAKELEESISDGEAVGRQSASSAHRIRAPRSGRSRSDLTKRTRSGRRSRQEEETESSV